MSLKLALSRISKSYNENTVLRDCSYTFGIGTYVLMGSNGSGKSTLLRICALLERPDDGDVNYIYDGAVVSDNIDLKRRMTLMLPKVGVFNATVFKNVAYGLRIRGLEKEILHEKVERAMDLVNLGQRKNQNALSLSSGETQRLGIARALVIEPEILFLDEPTASIDDKNAAIIENIILKMRENGKPTVIMATHDLRQAERLSEKILFMKEGRIAEKT